MSTANQTPERFFRFHIGEIECTAVRDGELVYPADILFPAIPAEERRVKAGVAGDELSVPYTCLAIRAGDQTVLIDTGIGKGVAPGAGQLHENLVEAGFDPGSMDTVVLTHGHPDHVGGLTTEGGEAAGIVAGNVDREPVNEVPAGQPVRPGAAVGFARKAGRAQAQLAREVSELLDARGEEAFAAMGQHVVQSHHLLPNGPEGPLAPVAAVRVGDRPIELVGRDMVQHRPLSDPPRPQVSPLVGAL
jgi:glyoxylase-like metal-dependent hydrolase (beta-lactamase superfamily II)